MIKHVLTDLAIILVVVALTMFTVRQCEYDQDRNDKQSIEFAKGVK